MMQSLASAVASPIDMSNGIRRTIDGFVEAFNANDLDRVMEYFSPDAVYCPGDGTEHRGRDAIRLAFEPQFRYAFGRMRFDEHDRIVDEGAHKMAIRWTCRHDLSAAKHVSIGLLLQRILVQVILGRRFGWEGLDVFHFDAQGFISHKFTYANYNRPQLRKELGVALV